MNIHPSKIKIRREIINKKKDRFSEWSRVLDQKSALFLSEFVRKKAAHEIARKISKVVIKISIILFIYFFSSL